MSIGACRDQKRASDRYPGTGVIGDCEPFDMGPEK